MVTFQEHGVLEFSRGAIVDMAYRQEGNELVIPSTPQAGAS